MDLVKQISLLRNERIKTTMRICDLDCAIYHIITREKNYFSICEENIDLIDIDNIKILNEKSNSINFTDCKNEYIFNISKSTLLKRFITKDNEILKFRIKILDDPFEYLNYKNEIENNKIYVKDYIILPLYSQRTNNVEKHSGLNQWNAKGRKRNEDEVYIPIPSWIHKFKNNFFLIILMIIEVKLLMLLYQIIKY